MPTFTKPIPSPPSPPTDDAALWRVYLLGGFRIVDARQRSASLRSRTATVLLARLALAPGRDHSREEVVALLWPEADALTGRNRLRQTLSLLKSVLEPAGGSAVLLADRRVLRVVPGSLWCDAVAFEHALRGGRQELAQSLDGGECLPGFDDDWVQVERERLDELRNKFGHASVAANKAPAAPSNLAQPVRVNTLPRPPQYLTRLIGADVEGARLRALVARQRLVTVLGAGGVGKTRLAVEVSRWLCEPGEGEPAAAFDATLFVPLIDVVNDDQLLTRLLQTLHVEPSGGTIQAAFDALEGRRLLMLIDNCEQLDDAAARVIAHLAERLPSLHWLLTSRRVLGVDGECVFSLDTLAPPAADTPLDRLAMHPAVVLYVDRARAQGADFHLQETNRAGLVALLHWLDGLPLAIELAAAHARTQSPGELLALLQSAGDDPHAPAGALAFLARRGTRSGSDPRHASMLAVVEWGWKLLDGAQQRLLDALCRCTDGTTLDEVMTLGEAASSGRTRVQSRLDELVATSVLRSTRDDDGQRRYRPYAAVRAYVLSRSGPARL